MLPMALINLATTAVWRFMQPGGARWFVCGLMVAIPYTWLGMGLGTGKISKRVYRYAG